MTDRPDHPGYSQVTHIKPAGKGRQEAQLDCGHVLVARKLWPGKRRWCPTCKPPVTRPKPPREDR